jgi:uncharacterized membrane protein
MQLSSIECASSLPSGIGLQECKRIETKFADLGGFANKLAGLAAFIAVS